MCSISTPLVGILGALDRCLWWCFLPLTSPPFTPPQTTYRRENPTYLLEMECCACSVQHHRLRPTFSFCCEAAHLSNYDGWTWRIAVFACLTPPARPQPRNPHAFAPLQNPEHLLIFAAGNLGDDMTGCSIASPSVSKNSLAVGSSMSGAIRLSSGDMDEVSDFSSKGPTADGRIKPDILAPGHYVSSLRRQGLLRVLICVLLLRKMLLSVWCEIGDGCCATRLWVGLSPRQFGPDRFLFPPVSLPSPAPMCVACSFMIHKRVGQARPEPCYWHEHRACTCHVHMVSSSVTVA